ncbi:MAG: GNAT family protein [Gudongella sp.]|nr:GNAT family protein [Gudongella sp.]
MLETKRLEIIEATDDYIDRIIEMESHPENRDFIWIGTFEEHQSEIRDKNHIVWIFKAKKDSRIVGYALVRLDWKSEIFELRRIVIINKGIGYGKEVMEAIIKYAFEKFHANRFWLDVYPDNHVGINLYEKLGLKKEGVLRQNYKSSRGYLDQIIYSKLREEYFEN